MRKEIPKKNKDIIIKNLLFKICANLKIKLFKY